MGYRIVEQAPSVTDYLRIRRLAGLGGKSMVAAEVGLAGSLFAVTANHDGVAVGMGRIVGDGGCFLQVVDVAVIPAHQGKGVGTRIMGALTADLERRMLPGTYVSLITDKPGFYHGFGFRSVAPTDRTLYLWRSQD